MTSDSSNFWPYIERCRVEAGSKCANDRIHNSFHGDNILLGRSYCRVSDVDTGVACSLYRYQGVHQSSAQTCFGRLEDLATVVLTQVQKRLEVSVVS